MKRLRLQLLAVLVLAIVLPLWPAAFAARELFERSFEPLLTSGLTESAEAGLDVVRTVMQEHKAHWLESLERGGARDTLEPARRDRWRLDERRAPESGAPLGALVLLRSPEVVTEDSSAVLVAQVRGATGVGAEPVWLVRALPDSLVRQAARLSRGAQLLQALRLERDALNRSFQATFLVVYLAMAAFVLGLGLWLTSRLTRPLAELGAGIDAIASGDLGARVPERSGGEIGELVKHFNAMAERLQTQQAELGRLERLTAWRQAARFLAHEIKNPLTPIQLAAQAMRDACPPGDERYLALVRESAAIIEEEVLGMRNLVSEFSEFARLPEIRAARVDSADLARELLGLYGPAQLAVTAGGEGAGVTLWADRDPLKRVLVNLVDNALAAQRSAGVAQPVELSFAASPSGGVSVRVRDRGTGIPDTDKRRVFEPDYTTKSDGMGLGLAIVEHLVRHHGGTIAVHDAPERGAVFAITLPQAPSSGGSGS